MHGHAGFTCPGKGTGAVRLGFCSLPFWTHTALLIQEQPFRHFHIPPDSYPLGKDGTALVRFHALICE